MTAFKTLWGNFPDDDTIRSVCFNKQVKGSTPFENYCSILLSECFLKSKISLDTCQGARCWSHGGSKHILRAEQLAHWLAKSPPNGFGRKQDATPSQFQKELSGRTGVVFFKDYWTRGNESFANRSGDHIDLWNKNEITGSGMLYRSLIEFLGFVSDLNKSKAVWFWEVR